MNPVAPLWAHQKRTIEMARRMPDLALFHQMGCGKSRALIEILREKYTAEKRLMKTLILTPLITIKNWQNEWKKYSKVKESDVVPLQGSGKKRVQKILEEAVDLKTGELTRAKIFILNYEALEIDEVFEKLKSWAPEILVCDESQRLKNGKGVRAKRVVGLLNEEPILGSKRYTRKVKNCFLLSGTPILNSAMDIFSQYRILDSGETFGLNFYEFRGRYFEDLNARMPKHVHFPNFVCRKDTYEKLNEKIYRKATRVLKKDCLDLPPIVRKTIFVDLGKEQRRLYEEMKKDFITWVNSPHGEPRAVVAQMAITKALRLQQIISGFVKTSEGVEYEVLENPRLKALSDLLVDLTPLHKVIVWCTFHHNYKQVAQVCKEKRVSYVELHGGITAGDKDKNIRAFQENPEARVIIANQHAAGVGINLVEDPRIVEAGRSSYAIFYSKNFSLDDDKQAESRNHRGGAEVYESITRIDLVAPGTIDELITQSLEQKQNIADRVLEWTHKI